MKKPLTIQERYVVNKATARRYQKCRKKARGPMLTEFCHQTCYTRSYAAFLLRNWGRTVTITVHGVRTVVTFGHRGKQHNRRQYPRKYGQRVVRTLKSLWALADGICSKRFIVWIRTTLPILEKFEEITLDTDTRQKLLSVSAPTVDRLLAPFRARLSVKGRSTTKPGTLLKHQIPIRTFAQWDDAVPGFVEIDLVSHDGGSLDSDVIQTLDVTDVSSAWTETRAVRNKAQKWVFEGLADIIKDLPFDLKGIDSDNGSEFINNHLKRFCTEYHITFTRSRPYRKNDSCYVEQKNWSVVRRTVGYYRYDTPEELRILTELYRSLRLYTNLFQPVMKLIEKTRIGSKVIKKYDEPKTPYSRVLDHPSVPKARKEQLSHLYRDTNPAELKRVMTQLQDRLFTLAEQKSRKQLQQKNNAKKKTIPYIHSQLESPNFE